MDGKERAGGPDLTLRRNCDLKNDRLRNEVVPCLRSPSFGCFEGGRTHASNPPKPPQFLYLTKAETSGVGLRGGAPPLPWVTLRPFLTPG